MRILTKEEDINLALELRTLVSENKLRNKGKKLVKLNTSNILAEIKTN